MDTKLLISFLVSIPTWVTLAPIMLFSVIILAVFIERSVFYLLVKREDPMIFPEISRFINEKKFDEALVAAQKSGSLYIPVIVSCIELMMNKKAVNTVEQASMRVIRKIERFSGLVSTVATVSTMFGLLGTVTGMMKSFTALAGNDSQSQVLLATGIAEALVTTATGLLVAIPSVILYNYMVSKSDVLIKHLEIGVNTLTGPSK